MIYREKPHFIIKRNLQKSKSTGVYFDQIATHDVLQDICSRVTNEDDFTVEFVDNKYTDEFYEATYNKGRIVILLYQDRVTYITISEKGIEGRNSGVQSVTTAFNMFFNSKAENKQLCYYFLDVEGNASTSYFLFIYRLMRTIGFEFINDNDVLGENMIPFASIEDTIHYRKENKSKNKSNNSTYLTKRSASKIDVYGKTYGANKYETTMICYAISVLLGESQTATLYEVIDNTLKELPKSCLEVLSKLGKVTVVPINLELEKTVLEDNNKIRSPRFINNLFERFNEKKCALCNCGIPELVQGAHIWPVASIKKEASLSQEDKIQYATDGNNGIWLCENHHKMFDENLITIENTGAIIISNRLDEEQKEFIESITTIKNLTQECLTNEFLDYLNKRYQCH